MSRMTFSMPARWARRKADGPIILECPSCAKVGDNVEVKPNHRYCSHCGVLFAWGMLDQWTAISAAMRVPVAGGAVDLDDVLKHARAAGDDVVNRAKAAEVSQMAEAAFGRGRSVDFTASPAFHQAIDDYIRDARFRLVPPRSPKAADLSHMAEPPRPRTQVDYEKQVIETVADYVRNARAVERMDTASTGGGRVVITIQLAMPRTLADVEREARSNDGR